jgi:DNA-binding NarL/FixJ family response regulator
MREALEASGRYAVGGEASGAHDGIAAVDKARPDISVLGVDQPRVSRVQGAASIGVWHPRAALVLLSAGIDDERLEAAVDVGASAFVVKESDGAAVVAVLDQVAAGENLLAQLVFTLPDPARRVLARFRDL